MTDREKAFVMNGLRNHIRLETSGNPDAQARTDERLIGVAERLGMARDLLEETRLEQQMFLALVMTLGNEVLPYDERD